MLRTPPILAPKAHVESLPVSAGGHPFSIASISSPLVDTKTENERDVNEPALVEMIVRVRAGVTRRLFDLANHGGGLEHGRSQHEFYGCK